MASRASKRVIYAALLGNLLVALTKFVAAGLTGSSAMSSEAIHSLVDTGNEVLLLYGLRRAARPPMSSTRWDTAASSISGASS
jgi:divalent metal cation (Fe/Co/Zn/Cd) transporter